MRRRAGLALTALALAGTGCDGGEGGEPRAGRAPGPGDLAWKGRPQLIVPETLPRDRILYGRVRNDSFEPVELTPRDLWLSDRDGDRVAGTAIFLQAFVHGLYPPTREPGNLPDSELRRTGRKALIRPGKTVPLTVSWREPAGGASPVRIDYGAGSLPIPTG